MDKKQNKRKSKGLAICVLVGIVIGLVGGLLLGMFFQQIIFTNGLIKIAEAFNGKVDISFNETKFAEQVKENIKPILNYTFSTVGYMNKFKNCTPVPCPCWYEQPSCALYCMECENGR